MTSSVTKIQALKPVLVAQLEDLLTGSGETGLILRPIVTLLRPNLEARVDAWFADGPEQADDTLAGLAGLLAALRSDDAEPIDFAGPAQRLREFLDTLNDPVFGSTVSDRYDELREIDPGQSPVPGVTGTSAPSDRPSRIGSDGSTWHGDVLGSEPSHE